MQVPPHGQGQVCGHHQQPRRHPRGPRGHAFPRSGAGRTSSSGSPTGVPGGLEPQECLPPSPAVGRAMLPPEAPAGWGWGSLCLFQVRWPQAPAASAPVLWAGVSEPPPPLPYEDTLLDHQVGLISIPTRLTSADTPSSSRGTFSGSRARAGTYILGDTVRLAAMSHLRARSSPWRPSPPPGSSCRHPPPPPRRAMSARLGARAGEGAQTGNGGQAQGKAPCFPGDTLDGGQGYATCLSVSLTLWGPLKASPNGHQGSLSIRRRAPSSGPQCLTRSQGSDGSEQTGPPSGPLSLRGGQRGGCQAQTPCPALRHRPHLPLPPERSPGRVWPALQRCQLPVIAP